MISQYKVHFLRRLAEEFGIYARRITALAFFGSFHTRVLRNIWFGWPNGWLKYPVHNEISALQGFRLFIQAVRYEYFWYLKKYPYLFK